MTDKHDEKAREIAGDRPELAREIASALRQVERETLERAAKVCESLVTGHRSSTGDAARRACFTRIRALIESEKVQP